MSVCVCADFIFFIMFLGLGSRCYSWKGSSWWEWGGPSRRINISPKYTAQRGEFIFNCCSLFFLYMLHAFQSFNALWLVCFPQTLFLSCLFPQYTNSRQEVHSKQLHPTVELISNTLKKKYQHLDIDAFQSHKS